DRRETRHPTGSRRGRAPVLMCSSPANGLDLDSASVIDRSAACKGISPNFPILHRFSPSLERSGAGALRTATTVVFFTPQALGSGGSAPPGPTGAPTGR